MERLKKRAGIFVGAVCEKSSSISKFLLLWSVTVLVLSSCGSESQGLQKQDTVRANIQITPFPLYDFGIVPIGMSSTKVFEVKNLGELPAEGMTSTFDLSVNFSYEGGAYPGVSGNCGEALMPGDSCQIVVVFAPQYSSSFSETIRVQYHDTVKERSTDSPLLLGKGG